jgi:hypothetical protein
MRKRYEPPVQSKTMQFVDIVFLLGAIFVTLWLPLELGLAGASKEIQKIENPTWESLQQTPGQVAQWEKLGYDAAKAHDVIQNRFDYELDWTAIIVMAAVLLGYFLFLFRASAKEYKEVIAEKFPDDA